MHWFAAAKAGELPEMSASLTPAAVLYIRGPQSRIEAKIGKG